ncbi:hypothetical protein HMPREF9336_04134 [Segniliparus rugosus ATCC BAA-974]|uniref:Uncharacterized protein n=1 Tax=Segniliparus rugosus (strain ATCC BAA-974 / DSM 45345 / CCUG 50838 / CIP 108380 / JCM 13579 / CDC 945) TaxID=679197 RepID=U1N8T8_SEGRC|nr:hypothetical protein HMPREF9336_04134 [Segniliparus rugosus ATCC BAA-974]
MRVSGRGLSPLGARLSGAGVSGWALGRVRVVRVSCLKTVVAPPGTRRGHNRYASYSPEMKVSSWARAMSSGSWRGGDFMRYALAG